MIKFDYLRSDYNMGDIIGVVINAALTNGEKYRRVYFIHPNEHPSDRTLYAVDYGVAYSPEYVYDDDFCLIGTADWKRKKLRSVALLDYDFNTFISKNRHYLSHDDCRIIFNNTETSEYAWVYAMYYQKEYKRKETEEK